jgi:hypothetical protein
MMSQDPRSVRKADNISYQEWMQSVDSWVSSLLEERCSLQDLVNWHPQRLYDIDLTSYEAALEAIGQDANAAQIAEDLALDL